MLHARRSELFKQLIKASKQTAHLKYTMEEHGLYKVKNKNTHVF